MSARSIRRQLVVCGVLVAASAAVAGTANGRSGSSSPLAGQIAAHCVSFYAGDTYFTAHRANCAKIGNCYASHLKGVTIAQFNAVATHNSSGTGPAPPKASNVHAAEKACDKALPGLSAFVDGTAGDT